jgi:FeS assembly SUF system regulator
MLEMVLQPDALHTASGLAEKTRLSLPTVSKILKILTKGKLLNSQRGSQGGYQLALAAQDISLAQIVAVLDGEISMTECKQHPGCCEVETNCNVKENWSVISQVIQDVLQNVSLQQMCKPISAAEVPLKFFKRVAT